MPFPHTPRNRVGLLIPTSASRSGEEGLGVPQPGPRARAAPLLPARPHLWPRRQPRRDSCISRSPPLGSRPRLAFSASRRPAAPPRHRAGPAAAATAATEGPRPSPAARPQRPAGADASAVLGKTPIRSRRPYRELVGAALHPGPAAPPSPGASPRRGRQGRAVASLSPRAVATASREPAPPRQIRVALSSQLPASSSGPGRRGRAAPGPQSEGWSPAGAAGKGRKAWGACSSRVSAPRSPLCVDTSQLRPGWGRRLNGDGEAGARAGS